MSFLQRIENIFPSTETTAKPWKDYLKKDEDLPILEPFFRFQNRLGCNNASMNNQEKQSFEHYKKCLKEYAEEEFILQRSVKQFDTDSILQAFGYQHDYDYEDKFTDEEDYKECVNELSETTKPSTNLFPELEYPLIAVVWIESDHDRSGPCGICCVDFIEKKEFDK